MWFGLLYCIPDEAPAGGERETVVLYAWEAWRERPFTVGCPLSAVPLMARLLREASTGSDLLAPHCGACHTPFDLPLL